MSYSLHYRNSQSNPYYSGITVPYPGYLYGASITPEDPIEVADIDQYFLTSLNGAAWAALTPEVKEQALSESQRWLATLCWDTSANCCNRDFQNAYLMAVSELALALATDPAAIIDGPSDGRWVKRERLDVLEQEYDMLQPNQGIAAPNSNYPLVVQRFPWLKDILGCWLQLGPKREIRLYRN